MRFKALNMRLPVWLFPGMNLRVILEMCGLIEGGTTDITPVRFLAGVDSSVIPERRVSGERLFANFALIGPFTGMNSLMILQMWTLRKLHAANATFKWLLTGMNSSVILQVSG